jgi:DNA-binding MarR family transcriptional regulator
MSKFTNLLLDNQLCFSLYAATQSITRGYRNRLAPLGLTYPQYLVLVVLWESGGSTVKGLADRLRLDSATLTPLLKRMEKAGLVTRTRDSVDQRVVNITLTERAREIEPLIAAIQNEVACSTQLGESDFRALQTSLHDLVCALDDDAQRRGETSSA